MVNTEFQGKSMLKGLLMKYLLLLFVLLSAACSHQHSHHNHGPALNHGQKWKTDETLRSGMKNIHTHLVQLIKKEGSGKVSDQDYLAFSRSVQKNTEHIIENCKMSPEMDRAYHTILEEMLDASEKLKAPGEKKTVTKRFVNAFHQYQEYFDQDFTHD